MTNKIMMINKKTAMIVGIATGIKDKVMRMMNIIVMKKVKRKMINKKIIVWKKMNNYRKCKIKERKRNQRIFLTNVATSMGIRI